MNRDSDIDLWVSRNLISKGKYKVRARAVNKENMILLSTTGKEVYLQIKGANVFKF